MRILIALITGLAFAACAQQSPMPDSAPKALGAVADRAAPPTDQQIQDFAGLADFVGLTLAGKPTADSDEQISDIQQWEWALGGTAILIRHALEDGSYGGETYIYKDTKSGELVYVYITNAGFHTVGKMTATQDGWIAEGGCYRACRHYKGSLNGCHP